MNDVEQCLVVCIECMIGYLMVFIYNVYGSIY